MTIDMVNLLSLDVAAHARPAAGRAATDYCGAKLDFTSG